MSNKVGENYCLFKLVCKETSGCYLGISVGTIDWVVFLNSVSVEDDASLAQALCDYRKYGISSFVFSYVAVNLSRIDAERLYAEYMVESIGYESLFTNTGDFTEDDLSEEIFIYQPLNSYDVASKVKVMLEQNMKISEICNELGTSRSFVSSINAGKLYSELGRIYPISKQFNKHRNFTEEELDNLYHDLIYDDNLTIKAISDKYGVAVATTRKINAGERYVREGYTYPLRSKEFIAKQLHEGKLRASISNKTLLQI